MANTTAIAADLNQLQNYGFKELKIWIRKNTFKALIVSLSVFILLLLLYILYDKLNPRVEENVSLLAKTDMVFIPPPDEQKDKPIELDISEIKPEVVLIGTTVVAGNPIAVPDAMIREEVEFASAADMAAATAIKGDLDLTKLGDDDLSNLTQHNLNVQNAPPSDDIPSSDKFIAVEQEPKWDESELKKNVIYPDMAKRANIEGQVILNVFVDKTGKVKKIELVKSDSDMLIEAAKNAILKTTFTPAIQNGQPVGCWVTMPIRFTMKSR